MGPPIAKLGGSSIPDVGLAEIGLDIHTAAIKFAERKNGDEVVLLAGAAKVAFGADDVAWQPVSRKPHDCSSVEPLRVVCFGGPLKPDAGSDFVLRPSLTSEEQAPNGDAGAYVALPGGAFIPVRRSRRIGGLAEPTKQHVPKMKLRGSHAGYCRRLQAPSREREIARTHPPLQIDRPDNTVRFPLPIASSFVQPAQGLVRIRPNFEAGRKKRFSIALRELSVTGRRGAVPFGDASALSAVQQNLSQPELSPRMVILRGAPVPLHRLGKIALYALAFDVKLRDPKGRFARALGMRSTPSAQSRKEAPSRIGRLPTAHVPRGESAPHRRPLRERESEAAGHGSRINSPRP